MDMGDGVQNSASQSMDNSDEGSIPPSTSPPDIEKQEGGEPPYANINAPHIYANL